MAIVKATGINLNKKLLLVGSKYKTSSSSNSYSKMRPIDRFYLLSSLLLNASRCIVRIQLIIKALRYTRLELTE